MQLIRIKYSFLLFVFGFFIVPEISGQNNAGIGTSAPHPSALLEVSDSSRGILIPRTDTLAILDYVNGLVPNPGIADGLLIFDTILNTYVYYDALNDDWKILLDLVGPTGNQGPQGPPGLRGDTGTVNDWRDSSGFDMRILAKDTCGDWFFDASSGRIWRVWCDTLGGTRPRMWIDTVLWDKPIGNMMAPDERIFAFSFSYSDFQPAFLESMANDSAIVVMKDISGLAIGITIQVDEVAYIWAAAHGTVGKAFAGNDMSYAQYELSFGGNEYYRGGSVQHIVTVGPNHPVSGRADLTGWYLSGNAYFEGDKTDPIACRCFTPYQLGSCPCAYNSKTMTVKLSGGNRYSGSSNTSFLILADGPSKETTAHFNIFVIIRRNPLADPRKL